MLPLDYLSTVELCHLNCQKGLTHIHNQVEDRLEIHLVEDCLEEDHPIETHLEDYHLIHLLDFMNG
jgi:hypothetical protein